MNYPNNKNDYLNLMQKGGGKVKEKEKEKEKHIGKK